MTKSPHLTILGGGPAGLAVAYFARRKGWQPLVLEAGSRVGGNCVTFQHGDFRFDSGAHRFHDKDPEITAEVQALVGAQLRRVCAPSAVYLDGRFLPFPPRPSDLLRHLGPRRLCGAAAGAVLARLRTRPGDDLESLAIRAYGPALAQDFLLNYSQKLWGVPCSTLSAAASGGRLSGLRLSALFSRRDVPARHMEGAFYYPRYGYGTIVERLAEQCGPAALRTGARVTRILHQGGRVTAIELKGGETLSAERVVSTLPLGAVARLLDPPVESELLAAADTLRFRNLILIAVFLDRPTVTPYASIYFPDPALPFTRVSEPRNRSADLAPAGKTSLVVEVPCAQSDADALWRSSDAALTGRVVSALAGLGWIPGGAMLDARVVRLPQAYPVLDLAAERVAEKLVPALSRFANLHLLGRNAQFRYVWLHSLLRLGKDLVEQELAV